MMKTHSPRTALAIAVPNHCLAVWKVVYLLFLLWVCGCPSLLSAQVTDCKKRYDEAVASANRSYEETVASIKKTARLNNMDVRKELRTLEERHRKFLESLKNSYDACVAQAERADEQAAKQINDQIDQARQNSSLRQFNSKSFNDQRSALQHTDTNELKGEADHIEREAVTRDNEAFKARQNGDYATAHALAAAASELRSQAGIARNLATRAQSEQQSEKNRVQREADQAVEAQREQQRKLIDQQTQKLDDALQEVANIGSKQLAKAVAAATLRQKVAELRAAARQAERQRNDVLTSDVRTAIKLLDFANKAKQLADVYVEVQKLREADDSQKPHQLRRATDEGIVVARIAGRASPGATIATTSVGLVAPVIADFGVSIVESDGRKIKELMASDDGATARASNGGLHAGANNGLTPASAQSWSPPSAFQDVLSTPPTTLDERPTAHPTMTEQEVNAAFEKFKTAIQQAATVRRALSADAGFWRRRNSRSVSPLRSPTCHWAS